jgi:hypothetical protein
VEQMSATRRKGRPVGWVLIMSPLWQFGDVSGSKVNRRLSEGSTPFASTLLYSGAINGRFRTHVRPVRAETTRGANLQIREACSEFDSVWALGAVIKKQMLFERVATCARVGCSLVLVEDLRSTRPMTGSGVSRMSSTRIGSSWFQAQWAGSPSQGLA